MSATRGEGTQSWSMVPRWHSSLAWLCPRNGGGGAGRLTANRSETYTLRVCRRARAVSPWQAAGLRRSKLREAAVENWCVLGAFIMKVTGSLGVGKAMRGKG